MTKFQLLSFGAAHKNGSEHALVAQPLHKTSILSQVQHGRASILDGADLTVVAPIFHPVPNARLRGWQRTTTKLKHNHCNHRGSMGLETPRVDSPS